MAHEPLEIIYDGDCPVCAAWMRMARLRQAAGEVELVDARSDDPRVASLMREGYDLDRGMVVRWQGRTYFGAEAMTLLTLLSDGTGIGMALQRCVFARPRIARIVYPLLVTGRLALLRVLGRRPIEASEGNRRSGE